MHLLMILTALTVAYSLRTTFKSSLANWNLRWRRSLFLFLFPPLLLGMTAIALLCMGTQGKMGNFHTGGFSYILAISYLAFSALLCIELAREGCKSIKAARNCSVLDIAGRQVRLLSTNALFAGQIGFWHPELVISEGLLQTLSPEHLETVLAHEQGHYHYRDTFWFFWLGWVRSCTAWLPNTKALWEELLILRELRADAYAASQVDRLLLAESLLLVVSTSPVLSETFCAALGSPGIERLEQRIESLLSQPAIIPEMNFKSWNAFMLALLPLLAVVFHT